MSMCFGVKIILQDSSDPVTQDTSIGLYNVASDNSEFRWCQNEISGLSTTWLSGMILLNGIERFSIEIDLRNGGDTSLPGTGSVSVNNLNKFWQSVQSKGIIFTGLKLEIWELGTGDHQKRIRTYFCREPQWDNKKYTIPFEGGQKVRIANILNVVNSVQYPLASKDTINTVIPATFGRLIPELNSSLNKITRSSVAKFIRTEDRVVYKKYSDAYFTGSSYEKTYIFPVTIVAGLNSYTCELRTATGVRSIIEGPENLYLKVVEGTGSGQIRKVSSLSYISTQNVFNVTVQDYFQTELNDDDSGDGRSWVQLIEVNRKYESDSFPCEGFYNSDEEKLENGAELYIYDNDDGMQRIAPYGYEFKDVADSNNKLAINPLLYEQGDLDTQQSFLILPVTNISAADDATLSNWAQEGVYAEEYWSTHNKHGTYDGLYAAPGSFPDVISNYEVSSFASATDRDRSTFLSHSFDGQQNAGSCFYEKVLYFDLPEIPENFTFDECYIGVKLLSKSQAGNSGSYDYNNRIMLRKFKYGVKIIPSGGYFVINEVSGDGAVIDNIPDFYCNDNENNDNQSFFVLDESEDNLTGYTNSVFDTGISSKSEYESYIQGAIVFEHAALVAVDPVVWEDTLKLYEFCFIFRKSSDIKKEIYSPVHGRKFSDTWGSRKVASDLIERPVDVLEHVCRLQNYRDTCSIPISGWGLQYSDLPLIATVGYGNFDDSGLASEREYDSAGQIFDLEDGYTDNLKNKVCNDFVLANWQDEDGYERVITLPSSKIDPVYTVQLSDITDRTKIKITALPEEKIVSEPWVNYNKNPANEEYEDAIYIKNTSASTFSINYVSGIKDVNDAQEIWNACHSLSLRTHKINKPSTNKTDLTFANGSGAYSIALAYLKNFVNWQFCDEIEFPIHYNIAGSWQECTPINILFSHQTNNISKSAIVERSELNPNPPYDIMIKAIMYA